MDQKCAVCVKSFTANNLAWLMSCCDHNICSQCLKQVKSSKRKQINCHECSKTYDVDQQTLQQFPKNINIIKMLRQSKTAVNQYNQSINQSNQMLLSNSNSLVRSHQSNCIKHGKPLQIICTVDRQFICSSCALFGQHKNHNINNSSFRTLQEFQNELKNFKYVFKEVQFKKNICEQSIRGKKYRSNIISKISEKKDLLVKEIKQKFQRIISGLRDAEAKLFQQLVKCFRTVDAEISKVTKQELASEKQYNRWKFQIAEYMKSLDESTSLKQKIHVFYQPNKPNIKQGQLFLRQLQQSFNQMRVAVQQKVNSIKVEFATGIQGFIYNYAQVLFNHHQIKIKSIKNIKPYSHQNDDKKMNKKQMKIQFVKSNDLEDYKTDKQIFKKQEISKKQESSKTTRNTLHKVKSNPKLPKGVLQRQEFKRTQTPPKLQNLKHHEQKRSQNLEFAQRMLNQFIKSTDTLDVTGCQLNDQQIIHIVSTAAKQKNIKCLKLSKNKLSNNGLAEMVQFTPIITNMNLSYNCLSDESIDIFIDRRQHMPCLRIINLSHNKLNERKIKTKVEQLRKFGIITTL